MQKGILRQVIHDSKRGAAAGLFRAVSEFATGKRAQWQRDKRTKRPPCKFMHRTRGQGAAASSCREGCETKE